MGITSEPTVESSSNAGGAGVANGSTSIASSGGGQEDCVTQFVRTSIESSTR